MSRIHQFSLILVILFSNIHICAQQRFNLSCSFTPGFTSVNISNYSNISFASYTREVYTKQHPDIPDFGYEGGISFDFRFRNNILLGLGYSVANKKSNSGNFYLRSSSPNNTFYYHRYQSFKVPIRLGYTWKIKKINPIVTFSIGPDFFKKFEMTVFSVENGTGKKSKSIIETHYGINYGLVRINTGIEAGVNIKIAKHIYTSLTPTFKYSSEAFRIIQCPNCSSFIAGHMWLLGFKGSIAFSL